MMILDKFYLYPKIEPSLFWLLAGVVFIILLVNSFYVYKRLQARKIRCAFVIGLNFLLGIVFLSVFLQIAVKQYFDESLHIVSAEIGDIASELTNKDHLVNYPASVAEVAKRLNNYNELVIHGDGFSEYQWQQLNALSNDTSLSNLTITQGQVSPTHFGFTKASWQRQLTIGESLDLFLRLSVPEASSTLYEIRFYDPANNLLDVKKARAGDEVSFTTQPPSQGQWLYRAAIFDNNDSELVSENISVEVKPGGKTQVLIVQSAPSFETRHLQNWLANQGSQVRVVTQISQSKFKQQALNVSSEQASQWEAMRWEQSLSWAELLVIDYRFVSQLSAQQQNKLTDAIKGGLGVYVLADSDFLQAPYSSFVTNTIGAPALINTDEEGALFRFNSVATKDPTAALGARFENSSNNIVVDENQQGLVNFMPLGQGKLAFALSQNTHNWRISGNRQLHSQYWQMMIKKLAKANQDVQWQLTNELLIDTSQSTLKLCADNLKQAQDVVLITPQNESIKLEQFADALYEDRRCVALQTETSGWYYLSSLSQENTNAVEEVRTAFYLDNKQSFKALSQYIKRQASAKRMQTSQANTAVINWRLIPDWALFFAFVFLATLLWSEQRFFGNE